jgi:hypothetical protein
MGFVCLMFFDVLDVFGVFYVFDTFDVFDAFGMFNVFDVFDVLGVFDAFGVFDRFDVFDVFDMFDGSVYPIRPMCCVFPTWFIVSQCGSIRHSPAQPGSVDLDMAEVVGFESICSKVV